MGLLPVWKLLLKLKFLLLLSYTGLPTGSMYIVKIYHQDVRPPFEGTIGNRVCSGRTQSWLAKASRQYVLTHGKWKSFSQLTSNVQHGFAYSSIDIPRYPIATS